MITITLADGGNRAEKLVSHSVSAKKKCANVCNLDIYTNENRPQSFRHCCLLLSTLLECLECRKEILARGPLAVY
jgi:hypothetical protein